ncbi:MULTISPECIES: prepilin-type N-terminal cleavage/methylation domain-containing protein [Candidatus Ichthyocystis]|uniref:prepilin-type N-terminal cleavage/methylation domain-containing protein n=1 Tax=Candidatus Ichthyocystis TaxID=2929841 RepID=UPI000B83575E|nr:MULTISPECIES: prepilin-type N-terminal cleavage/methylation domain-containing protein [Ichthyocystis]
MPSNAKGFSVLEFMIAVSMIAILASVSATVFVYFGNRSQFIDSLQEAMLIAGSSAQKSMALSSRCKTGTVNFTDQDSQYFSQAVFAKNGNACTATLTYKNYSSKTGIRAELRNKTITLKFEFTPKAGITMSCSTSVSSEYTSGKC